MRNPVAVLAVAITTTALAAGLDSAVAGADSTQATPGSNCETTLYPANSAETCTPLEIEAFTTYGARLPALYSAAPGLQLGNWAPQSVNDTTLNFFSLMACQYLVEDFSELGWLELTADVNGPTMAENEALFDAAMTYLCPEFNYRRQLEWDNYVPFDLLDPTTTTTPGAPVPQVTTTVPGAVTTQPAATAPTAPTPTTLPPVPPPSTATSLPPATPTTAIPAGAVIVLSGFDSSGNPVTVQYTCTALHDYVVEPPRPCQDVEQTMFNQIIGTSAVAFQTLVDSTTLGNFSTLPNIGHEGRAWIGLTACVDRSIDPANFVTFDEYSRQIFTGTTPGDSQLMWDEAHRVLCPFLT